MSLAKTLATISIAPEVRNKILIIDVERLDGITAQHWWSRGDLKNRYIHYETVMRQPRVTIVCAKWYHEPDVIRMAEWDPGGRKRFLRRVHRLLERADIIVGHNLERADLPWLRGDLHVEAGLPPLPPHKTVDTLKVLRTQFGEGAPFKSLDAFCRIAGLPPKRDHYDREAMERAVTEKSVADRQRLVEYCAGDVIATQGLYDYLRPHIKNHPALFVDGKDKLTVCNRCGHNMTRIARRYVAHVLTYSMRQCEKCGAYSRLSIEPERMSVMRGV